MVKNIRGWIDWGHTAIGGATSTGPAKILPSDDLQAILGSRISYVFRRGKYIVFVIDAGWLVCHNAMTGYWDVEDEPWTFDYVEGKRKASDRDVRATILIGERTFRFHDSRKFGSLRFYRRGWCKSITDLGPEALFTFYCFPDAKSWDATDLWHSRCASRTDKPIKELLMDQKQVAGIGNIYACEALFEARISPLRPIWTLTFRDVEDIVDAVKTVMKKSISSGIDYSLLKVYRRDACPWDHPVSSEKLKDRTTYFCKECQR